MTDHELDDILTGKRGAGTDPDPELRNRILAATTAQVKRRAGRRPMRTAAGWAAAYALGVATVLMWMALPPLPRGEEPVAPVQSPRPVVSDGSAPSATPADVPIDPEQLAFRLREATSAERPALLKRAADRVLVERGDVNRAAAYYEQYLQETAATVWTDASPQDTWLLAALRSGASLEGS